jgi:hypothetical protein
MSYIAVGASMGLLTQLCSNAVRKLPLMQGSSVCDRACPPRAWPVRARHAMLRRLTIPAPHPSAAPYLHVMWLGIGGFMGNQVRVWDARGRARLDDNLAKLGRAPNTTFRPVGKAV